LKGDSVSLGGSLPLQLFQYRSLPIGDDIGYVKFNLFAMAVVGRFCDSLTEFKDKKGIIVDLRGNVGGILGTILGITGMVSDQPTSIGTSKYRTDSETLIAQPKKKRFDGRLIFLVDGDSLSAAEIMAASMQDNRRAIIVGERTAGEALPSVSKALATGAVLVYPIANFISPNGRSIEGSGVEPDYAVRLDRKSLLNGVDTQLEKAVSLIRSGAAPQKPAVVAGAGEPVPPPPPAKVVGGGPSVKPPPPALPARQGLAAAGPAPRKDEAAVKVIDDFIAAIGGRPAFNAIKTYEATGRGIVTFRGVNTDIEIHAIRQDPDKFAMVISSPAMGESREVYNGQRFMFQTEYGLDFSTDAIPDAGRMQLFSVVFDIIDPATFPSLTFEGTVELEGRKVNAITAKTKKGITYGLIFDDESKLLVRYAPPGIVGEVGDYRKVGDVTLPFKLYLEPVMHIQLDKVDLNVAVDPSNFERKEKCFDKEQ
jgi:hypothetical protein